MLLIRGVEISFRGIKMRTDHEKKPDIPISGNAFGGVFMWQLHTLVRRGGASMEKGKVTFGFEDPNNRLELERLLLKMLIDKLVARQDGAAEGERP